MEREHQQQQQQQKQQQQQQQQQLHQQQQQQQQQQQSQQQQQPQSASQQPHLQRLPPIASQQRSHFSQGHSPHPEPNRSPVESAEDFHDEEEDEEEEGPRGRGRSRDGGMVEGSEASGNGQLRSNTETPTTRKRRRSRKGLDKKFECPHPGCGKSYSRAEHLYRHQLNRKKSAVGSSGTGECECECDGAADSVDRRAQADLLLRLSTMQTLVCTAGPLHSSPRATHKQGLASPAQGQS